MICTVLIILIIFSILYLSANLLSSTENFRGHRGRGGRRGGWGRRDWGRRSRWWGPRWAYLPTISYPYCNPFWGDCPSYLYNPYNYVVY